MDFPLQYNFQGIATGLGNYKWGMGPQTKVLLGYVGSIKDLIDQQ